ncbi:MAG TPA: hypothetical protein VMF09_14055 [Solirubrobacteraceae bacterium]|nr:hypothetical protein [Solirubrobacteraceae bacterium]
MAAGEQSEAIAELASETVAPIEEELRGRLTVALGERDLLALESALLKAFLSGMGAASAEVESMIDQLQNPRGVAGEMLASPGQVDQPLPRLDPWAARYGGG